MTHTNTFRRCSRLLVPVLLLATPIISGGCEANRLPEKEIVEQALALKLPAEARVIGSQSAINSTSILVLSKIPLPLPDTALKTSRSKRRPAGAAFPVSALLNLAAAYDVAANDVPKFTLKRGRCHDGTFKNYQFTYREAAIEAGWLTAVEIFRLAPPGSQRVEK